MNPLVAYQFRIALLSWIESGTVVYWLWTAVIGLSVVLVVVLTAMFFQIHQWLTWQEERLLEFAAFQYFS